jgi:DNA-directed RNA polymerase specialized sigma24 family protein
VTEQRPLVAQLLAELGDLPALDRARAITELLAAVPDLTAQRRAIVAEHHDAGMSQAELARQIGVTPGAIYHLVRR